MMLIFTLTISKWFHNLSVVSLFLIYAPPHFLTGVCGLQAFLSCSQVLWLVSGFMFPAGPCIHLSQVMNLI